MAKSRQRNERGKRLGSRRRSENVLEKGGCDGDFGCNEGFLGNCGELDARRSCQFDELCPSGRGNLKGTYVCDVCQEIKHGDHAHGERQRHPESLLGVTNFRQNLKRRILANPSRGNTRAGENLRH